MTKQTITTVVRGNLKKYKIALWPHPSILFGSAQNNLEDDFTTMERILNPTEPKKEFLSRAHSRGSIYPESLKILLPWFSIVLANILLLETS